MMLQQDQPADYVVATNETHSVREFVEKAFKVIDIDVKWKGEGIDEVGFDEKTGKELVKVDPRYFRPTEVEFLWGDYSKANKAFGWKPEISFDDLVREMVEMDLESLLKQGKEINH